MSVFTLNDEEALRIKNALIGYIERVTSDKIVVSLEELKLLPVITELLLKYSSV